FTAVIAAFVILSLVFVVVQCAPFIATDFTNDNMNVMLHGEYSVDGGEWKSVDPGQSINDHFHKITIKGKLNETAAMFEILAVSSKDIWYTLKTADGEYEIYNRRTAPDMPEEYFLPADRMLNTPGYELLQINTEQFPEKVRTGEQELILEVEYPYHFATKSFSDCFSVTYSRYDGLYNQLFFKSLPSVLIFVLVCFFGLFFFPVSGFVLGKVNYKYLCFGLLCFFWGLYMITQSLSSFMNLWITDVTMCLFAVKIISYLFVTSIFLYLKSNLQKPLTRAIANCTIVVFFLTVVAAAALHLTNKVDLTVSDPNVFIVIAVCAVTMIALLISEIRGNHNALVFLISWSPLILTLVLDIIDQYVHLAGSHFFNYGLAITMAYQIVNLILDLRTQYKEAIRYQQMQKELYEAKVAVMVSQIHPHFMYNALSSIAMMCTLDPKIAKEATITFAKYLRGNMDSLKQTGPVPFTQELEHLKKYLYIEKLRFDDLLNIEYDIQATDFVLPLLSVQPLVENAVKHGVGMKEDGGTVRISTRETETAYEVVIEDDGVGFDVNEQKDDGRSHVGMENTKKRLHDMCGGEVKIESVVGKGTTAIVILPKEGQPNEDTLS
ncbi:MAG: histidine kinase, partial [Ruminococcus sp.]|nr:histidine kinase [Ruminococcus sp.]